MKSLEEVHSYSHAAGEDLPISVFDLKDNTVTLVEVYCTAVDLTTKEFISFYVFWPFSKVDGVITYSAAEQQPTVLAGTPVVPVSYIELGIDSGLCVVKADVTSTNLVQFTTQVNVQENTFP